ncbi:MAG: hypothetical protein O7D96_03495 [SAR324 cluster bacterium]|nr:hypothetical protein [SAR324 cluster bacterium]
MKPAGIGAAFALAAIGLAVVLAAALTAVMPAELRAAVFGNPVPNIAEGEQAVGVSFTDDRLTGFYDRGVSPQGVAQLLVGLVQVGRADGVEIGVGYRHRLDEPIELKDEVFRFGILGFARYGEAEEGNVEISYLQLDIGLGGVWSPVEKVFVFGGPIFRRVSAKVSNQGRGGGGETDTDLGLYAGGEYWMSPTMVIGGELHFGLKDIFDEDLGIYAELKF